MKALRNIPPGLWSWLAGRPFITGSQTGFDGLAVSFCTSATCPTVVLGIVDWCLRLRVVLVSLHVGEDIGRAHYLDVAVPSHCFCTAMP